jgi:hypothetical protein
MDWRGAQPKRGAANASDYEDAWRDAGTWQNNEDDLGGVCFLIRIKHSELRGE